MRGNSGFLRWLPSYYSTTNRTLLIVLFVAITSTHAGPLNTRHRRMIRDVYSEFESQSQNITQPAEGTCLHDGTQVPETSVQCAMKAGCRAIQKTGYCCPEYQCDCERDGKFYTNGEKLVDPETPCKGCYCQGGEILCNSVNCYIRNDCQPKYIAGRCCPEYDNCPPIESGRPHLIKEATTPEAQSTRTALIESSETLSTTTQKQEAANNNPLGIKIKETTKPEEIRIIDEKPKPTYQLIKPFESTSSNQHPNAFQATVAKAEQTILNSVETQLIPVNVNNENIPSNSSPNGESESSIPAFQVSISEPSGTTSEPVNKLEVADVNSITDEDALKTVRHAESVEQSASNASWSVMTETSIPDKEMPEEIGKEVVIVDSNGQTKPITVFGVEGLQRGDVLDEASEYEEKKAATKRFDSNLHNSENTSNHPHDTSTTGPEIIYENTSAAGQYSSSDIKTLSEIDPVGASSDDFIQIVVTTKISDGTLADSTTEGLTDVNRTTGSNDVYDTVYYTSGPDRLVLEDSNSSGLAIDTVYYEPDLMDQWISTEGPQSSVLPAHQSLIYDDETMMSNEPNPAYPAIRDDLSIYGTEVLSSDEELPVMVEKILPDVLIFKSNSSRTENASNCAPSAWLKHELISSTRKEVLIDNVSDMKPQLRSPGEPLLIPDWERNSTDATMQNSTTTSNDSTEDEVIVRNDSLDLDVSMGSGDGSLSSKEREPTTPNSMNINLDIDEDGSGGLEHDPKEDIESLKYHDANSDPSYIRPALDSGLQALVSAINDFQKSNLMDVLKFT